MVYSDELYSRAEEEIITTLSGTVEIIRPTSSVRSEMKARTKPVYDFCVDRGDYTWDDIDAAIAASTSCDRNEE
jgi:hypothetical protein